MQRPILAALEQEIDRQVSRLADSLSQRFDITAEQVLQVWNEVEDSEGSFTPIISAHGCTYVYCRGDKSGQRCNAKLKNAEQQFCKKHQRAGKKLLEKKKQNLVFRRHKQYNDFLWHAETGFVMKTAEEGVVGKLVSKDGENKIVLEITEEMIKKCTELGLPVASPKQ